MEHTLDENEHSTQHRSRPGRIGSCALTLQCWCWTSYLAHMTVLVCTSDCRAMCTRSNNTWLALLGRTCSLFLWWSAPKKFPLDFCHRLRWLRLRFAGIPLLGHCYPSYSRLSQSDFCILNHTHHSHVLSSEHRLKIPTPEQEDLRTCICWRPGDPDCSRDSRNVHQGLAWCNRCILQTSWQRRQVLQLRNLVIRKGSLPNRTESRWSSSLHSSFGRGWALRLPWRRGVLHADEKLNWRILSDLLTPSCSSLIRLATLVEYQRPNSSLL